MATRERNRTRDRSKSSDISGEPTLAAAAAAHAAGLAAQARAAPSGPHRLASWQAPAAPAAATAAAPQASTPPLRPNSAADLLVAAAAAVSRADALQRAEASESDVSPKSWQAASHGAEPRRRREKGPERHHRKDRFGEVHAKPDELRSQAHKQELRGERDGSKPDEASTVSGPDTKRARRKVLFTSTCGTDVQTQYLLPSFLPIWHFAASRTSA